MNLARFKPLVILTGAGISAESGIKTFRDSGGLWENHRLEDVATPEGFQSNPQLVHQFYNERRRQLKQVVPNAAHMALARLEKEWEGDFLLVTQNVDDLHQRAGSRQLIAMHGELLKVRCQESERVFVWPGDLSIDSVCSCCKRRGSLRPHIVWFGEMPLDMDSIQESLGNCEIFISIGTSGNVYPAAGFVRYAFGAKRIEVNLEPSMVSEAFQEHQIGPAAIEVPKLVDRLLGESL